MFSDLIRLYFKALFCDKLLWVAKFEWVEFEILFAWLEFLFNWVPNAEGVSRKEMCVLEHFCSFEMCLDIKYFVQRQTRFLENFGI